MILEKGDYFVVTRGWEIPTDPRISGGCAVKTKPRYDRGREGRIYLALQVASDGIVAARCVWSNVQCEIGRIESMHTDQIEVMTVTREFLDVFGVK